ncbi:MAG: hypothetical protein CFH28_00454 [Alphaproteobacteria bacterium MarineAlpha6_Bin6]|nr:hypothetical protein [Pelagibacteraceae bacterium]PPR31631.1 MAG: hypothetical protein CFH28_00454 [Alphaproteobacteria bacterium MarineAlpha6_Bin6]
MFLIYNNYLTFGDIKAMDEKFLNLEIRKFLKNFGITSQREIEIKIREALNNGSISENENLEVEANLNIGKINLTHKITGNIKLN